MIAALAARGVDTSFAGWSAAGIEWDAHDLVVIRSVWNYPQHHAAFLAWVRGLGTRVENAPALIAWNSDKRYLTDLDAAGIPVVPTTYVAAGERMPTLTGRTVVKPTVSVGARHTGRFGPESTPAAAELVDRITAGGGTAMLQPYLDSVDAHGETAIATIDGAVTHVLRKGVVLRADGVAPMIRDGPLQVAEVMGDPELMTLADAPDDELALARRVVDHVAERFGAPPLIARIDMLRDADGTPLLVELEAVDPSLYLSLAPDAVERLADAILTRLTGSTSANG